MNFDDASKLGNLIDLLEEQYGRWGHFTKEAADLALNISRLEGITPTLICFTHLNEATFDLYPLPNTNGNDQNFWGWDVGTFQLNVGWTCKSIWVREFRGDGLAPNDVLGTLSTVGGKLQPTNFNGNPVTNGRLAARKLYRLRQFKTSDEGAAVAYTGPKAQPKRLECWQKYAHLLDDFFSNYTP